MLISYENDVIPIPKEIQRSFEDDPPHIPAIPVTESAKRTKGSVKHSLTGRSARKTVQGPEEEHTAEKPEVSNAYVSEQNTINDTSKKRSPSAPSSDQAKVDRQYGYSTQKEVYGKLKALRNDLHPTDRKDGIADYKEFNDHFYRGLRKMEDDLGCQHFQHILPEETTKVLDEYETKNQPSDIADSVLPSNENDQEGKKPVTDFRLLIPDKLVNPNTLRNGEVSCWDKHGDRPRKVCPAEGIEPFQWTSHGHFSVDAAITNLHNFFQKEWKRDDCWRFNVELLSKKHKPGLITTYIFESCWSIPTRKAPVPAATASIYFTMDVCDAKRPEAPVIVKCHYENSPMILDPQTIHFGHEILIDIMKRKQILAERLIS